MAGKFPIDLTDERFTVAANDEVIGFAFDPRGLAFADAVHVEP